MAADQGAAVTAGAASARAEGRHLETARELGEHRARIEGLERRFDRELGDMRSTLTRIEGRLGVSATAAQDPNLMLAVQGINRVLDRLDKPQPQPLDIQQILAAAGGSRQGGVNMLALIISLIVNGGLVVLVLRLLIGG